MTVTPTLHFTRDEFAARLNKTRSAMQEKGIEVLIVSDPSNMNWLTGYDGWSFYVHQAVVVTLSDEPLWFGRGQDANGALRTCYMSPSNIIGYADHFVQSTERHPMDELSAQLKDRGLGTQAIGVEMDNYWFTAAAYNSLRNGLPDARFSDATGLVNWQRAIKSDAEIGYMRQAGQIVSKMHRRIVEHVKPGVRKCDLVAEIYDAGLRYDEGFGVGGDYPAIVPLLPSCSSLVAEGASSHLE